MSKFALHFVNGDPQQNAQGFFSLYVHLMKGKIDYRLNWPFQHSVILELLHKEDEKIKKNMKQMLPFDCNLADSIMAVEKVASFCWFVCFMY